MNCEINDQGSSLTTRCYLGTRAHSVPCVGRVWRFAHICHFAHNFANEVNGPDCLSGDAGH